MTGGLIHPAEQMGSGARLEQRIVVFVFLGLQLGIFIFSSMNLHDRNQPSLSVFKH